MKFFYAFLFVCYLSYADAVCVSVRGHVMCPDKHNKHDGKLVVIKLMQGDRSELDEGYASKNGLFAVQGCTRSVGNVEPQLHIISKCKGDLNSRIRYNLPRAIGQHKEFNISDLINLKSYHQREDTYNSQIYEPCSTN